jgi:malate dehydrogenase (oxaloacetate-decarboxylating)
VVETLGQQAARADEALGAYRDDLAKHVYLRGLQDTNEVLFYKLLVELLRNRPTARSTPSS